MDRLVTLLGSYQSGNDNKEIIEYASQHSDRIVSDWVYAANTSNHSSYGAYTIALVTVLEMPEFPSAKGTSICQTILKDEIKTLYRALTMVKPAQTVPTINLLTQMVRFCGQELLNEFDFTLSAIRKLLAQQPFRQAFLKFYILLTQSSSGSNRRELVSNRKIVSLWFGKLGTDDDEDTIVSTLETLTKYILKDTTNFTKSAKMGIFNDWTLRNFMKVLVKPDLSQRVIDEMNKFILMLLCDKTHGVRMNAGGEQKLALSFLKIIKPWENVHEMDLVVKILNGAPELFIPYFDQLSLTFNLAPKSTMFWVSFAVLHIRALKLDAKKDVDALFDMPGKNALLEPKLVDMSKIVLPATVTKSHLTQAVGPTQTSSFVRYEAAQIILFGLRRLHAVVENVYKPRQWDPTMLIEDIIGNRLPEAAIFSKECDPPLLRTIFCMILKEMGAMRQLHSVPITLNLESTKNISGLELIQAENLLEVQTYIGDQTKWWNPTKGASLSLFTQLLKFATYNTQLTDKCSQLLQHLVQPTQLFADIPVLTNPMDALLFTLTVTHSTITWEVIEQAIQRAVNSPYQYIDKVHSSKVSPFLVALIDQYNTHFAEREKNEVDASQPTLQWVRLFARSLVILGEDEAIISNLLSVPSVLDKNCNGGGKDEYFNFALDASDNEILQRKDLLFKISNKLELAATVWRIAHTTNDKVRNYLLANLPSDTLPVLASEVPGFTPFFKDNDRLLLKAFLTAIDANNSAALTEKLEESSNWDLGIPRLSTDFLLEKLSSTIIPDEDIHTSGEIISELTKRNIKVPANLLPQLLDYSTSLSDNLELWNANEISETDGEQMLSRVKKSPKLAAQLIKVSGFYGDDHPLAHNGIVLVAAAKYSPQRLDVESALKTAAHLLSNGDHEGITIIANLNDRSLTPELSDALSAYIEGSKSKSSQSVLHKELIEVIVSQPELPSFVGRWLKITVHELTKRYFEDKIFAEQYEFIESFNSRVLGNKSEGDNFINVWEHVNANEVNSLIEAIVRKDRHKASYELVSRLSLQALGTHTSKLSSVSHVSNLLEKTHAKHRGDGANDIELAEVLCLFSLITANLDACSTPDIEKGILARYDGSLVAKDRILCNLLQQIESIRQRSWVEDVESWDLRPMRSSQVTIIDDYDLDPLIVVKNGTKVFVTVDEQRVRETTQFFEKSSDFDFGDRSDLSYSHLLSVIEKYDVAVLPSYERACTLYDNRFLLSLIVSCEYVMENPEVFLTSGLLSFVLCCLSDEAVREDAFSLLRQAFVNLEEKSFKDKVSVRLLLGKILALYSEQQQQGAVIPSHIPVIAGQIALILANPNHFLYEEASEWLLSSPLISRMDVPLSRSIFSSQSDLKLREMVWLVNSLKSGAVDDSAVQSYVRSDTIEWVLCQYRLTSTRSAALKTAIQALLDRIEEVRRGSSTLITTSAGLAVPEIKERLFYSAGEDAVAQYAK